MKIFVTGVCGQLGHDVMNELNGRGYEGIGSDIAPEYSGAMDGTPVTTMPYIQNSALICKELDCKMVYISTDYVFDGQGTTPWDPDCKDYKPLNVYGQTKLEGELAVSGNLDKYFIVRIAWVFGVSGKNFIKTMLNVVSRHVRDGKIWLLPCNE